MQKRDFPVMNKYDEKRIRIPMEKNTSFIYSYSAKENKEVQEIRKRYLPQEESKLDELKELDRKVKRPVNVFAYIFGTISAIIMGSGMSFVMTDVGRTVSISEPMPYGIIIGIVGMFMAIVNYPMYKGILDSRKKKYGAEIIKLSDSIMNS